ncbi:MAG: hypothetical protein QM704_23040 [Anaeromyxobacteraceae bacterium]
MKAVDAADFSIRYGAARRLFEQGKFAEAGGAFEQLAAGTKGGDPAAALDAAGFAWEKAGDAKKAAALREKVVKDYKDSEVAPGATLALAGLRSKAGDHAAAAKLYETWLERWPKGTQRCAVLRNAAISSDQAEQWVEAAKKYERFGADADCTKESPDGSLLAYYRAGRLYDYVKKKAEAKAAFQAVVAVQGAKSPEAQQALDDAKKRVK